MQLCKVRWGGAVTDERPPHLPRQGSLPQLSTRLGKSPLCAGTAGRASARRWFTRGPCQVAGRQVLSAGPESTCPLTPAECQGQREQLCQHIWRLSWAGMPQEYGATPAPQNVPCGASTGMGGSQKLALSLRLLLVLLTVCAPHTQCPGPRSQGRTKDQGDICSPGPGESVCYPHWQCTGPRACGYAGGGGRLGLSLSL